MSTHDESELNRVVAEAVAEGIKQALSDPELWTAALAAMKKHAATTTGSFLLDSMVGLMRRAALFGFVGIGIYWLGGWSALAAVVKAIFGSGGTT